MKYAWRKREMHLIMQKLKCSSREDVFKDKPVTTYVSTIIIFLDILLRQVHDIYPLEFQNRQFNGWHRETGEPLAQCSMLGKIDFTCRCCCSDPAGCMSLHCFKSEIPRNIPPTQPPQQTQRTQPVKIVQQPTQPDNARLDALNLALANKEQVNNTQLDIENAQREQPTQPPQTQPTQPTNELLTPTQAPTGDRSVTKMPFGSVTLGTPKLDLNNYDTYEDVDNYEGYEDYYGAEMYNDVILTDDELADDVIPTGLPMTVRLLGGQKPTDKGKPKPTAKSVTPNGVVQTQRATTRTIKRPENISKSIISTPKPPTRPPTRTPTPTKKPTTKPTSMVTTRPKRTEPTQKVIVTTSITTRFTTTLTTRRNLNQFLQKPIKQVVETVEPELPVIPEAKPEPSKCAEWTNWSNCSKTCGGGFKQRIKICAAKTEQVSGGAREFCNHSSL